jgi:hypothetical protein
VFTWADGTIYKGQFANDLKEGDGELFYTDGAVVNGQWVADQPLEKE